jgi:hypothetical protein
MEEKENPTAEEETPKKSNREAFMERYKADFPDDNYEDEEAIYGRMNQRNADYDRLRTNDDNFRKLVNEHPEYGGMVADMMEGKSFIESFLARFSDEDITAARNDPEMAKKLADAQAEYLKSVEDNKRIAEEREVNVQQSIKELNAYCNENNIDGGVANEIWGKCLDHAVELCQLKFTPELFDLVYKGMSHDDDVAAAREEGEIAGHNAKVQTQMAKGQGPEGIPPTFDGGQGGVAAEPKPVQKKKFYNPFSHEMEEA